MMCKMCRVNKIDNTDGTCNDCFGKPQIFYYPTGTRTWLKDNEWGFLPPEPKITPEDEHNFYKKVFETNL